jgi:hypothetical protein
MSSSSLEIFLLANKLREMLVEEQLAKSKLKRGAEIAAFNLLDTT